MTHSRRAFYVVRKLEEASKDRAARKTGAWASTLELQKAAGIGFKVAIHELHNKKKPERGLGFVIARRSFEDESREYGYMIVGYPIWWGNGGWDGQPEDEDPVRDEGDGVDGTQLRLSGMQACLAGESPG